MEPWVFDFFYNTLLDCLTSSSLSLQYISVSFCYVIAIKPLGIDFVHNNFLFSHLQISGSLTDFKCAWLDLVLSDKFGITLLHVSLFLLRPVPCISSGDGRNIKQQTQIHKHISSTCLSTIIPFAKANHMTKPNREVVRK